MTLKSFTLAFFILLNCVSNYSQSKDKMEYWIDINGKSVSKEIFLKHWKTHDSEFASWSYIAKDSGHVTKTHYKFNLYTINYSTFLGYINRISNKNLAANSVLLIEFHYKDDLCSDDHSNTWSWRKLKIGNITLMNRKNLWKVNMKIWFT